MAFGILFNKHGMGKLKNLARSHYRKQWLFLVHKPALIDCKSKISTRYQVVLVSREKF